MRKLLALILSLALLLTMAGTVAAFAEEHEDVEIVVFQRLGSDDRNAILQNMLNDMGMGYVHLRFVDAVGDTSESKYSMMMQAGETIDMVMDVETGADGNFYYSNNWMVPLDDYFADWDDWALINDNTKMACRSPLDGKMYYLPYGRFLRVLFYRADWLEEAGIAVPTTWDELLDASIALTDPDNNRYGYSFRGVGGANYFQSYLLGLFPFEDLYPHSEGGPSICDVMRDGSCVWENREVIAEALEYWKKLYKEGSPADSLTWGYPEMVEGFYSGVTAFLIQDCEVIATCEKYMEDGTWYTAALPKSNDGYIFSTGGDIATGMGVCSASKHVDLCVDILKTLFGVEGALRWCDEYGLTPVYSSIEGYDMGYYQAYADMAATGKFNGFAGAWLGGLMDDDDKDYVDSLAYNLDTLLQGYLTDQLTADDVIDASLEYNSWWTDKPEIEEIRQAAAK